MDSFTTLMLWCVVVDLALALAVLKLIDWAVG